MVRVALLDALYANAAAIAEAEEANAKDDADQTALPVRYDEALLVLLFAMVDEQGERLFDLADYPEFTQLSYDTQVMLWRAHQDLTLPKRADEQKKSTDSTPNDGSSTD